MPLKIKTFSNQSGGNAFYKAVTHPAAAKRAHELIVDLKKDGRIAVYDPYGQFESFAEFFPLKGIDIAGYFVQDVEQIGREFGNLKAEPVTAIASAQCRAIF